MYEHITKVTVTRHFILRQSRNRSYIFRIISRPLRKRRFNYSGKWDDVVRSEETGSINHEIKHSAVFSNVWLKCSWKPPQHSFCIALPLNANDLSKVYWNDLLPKPFKCRIILNKTSSRNAFIISPSGLRPFRPNLTFKSNHKVALTLFFIYEYIYNI